MIHSLSRIYSPDIMSSKDGRHYVFAVSLPWVEPFKDAWAVFRGRAVAFQYPKAGDLEKAIGLKPWDRVAFPSVPITEQPKP